MFTTQNLQYFTSKFYDKIKNTFLSKEDGVKGVILGQDWELVNSVVANNPITLPSIDTFEEIYIETQSNDATIVHQVSLNKDSLLFESTNTTHREILIDSLLDVQTYATYNIANNTITLSSYEGTDVDSTSTTITTKVYVKKMSEVNGTIPSSRVTYDDTTTQLGANSLQNAIEKVDNKVKNITLSAENTTYDNSTSGMYATNVQEAIDDLSEATSNLPSVGTQITGVLNAGETEITFANENITSDSTLNAVYTSKYGVSVNSAVFGQGTLTLTFSAQEENIDVLVVIDASLSYGGNGSDGADGKDGKSAYEYAVEGGYTGTETEFSTLFNNIGGGSEWTKKGQVTGNTTITLPETFNEILITTCQKNTVSNVVSVIVPYIAIEKLWADNNGSVMSLYPTGMNAQYNIRKENGKFTLQPYGFNNNSASDWSTNLITTIYYR